MNLFARFWGPRRPGMSGSPPQACGAMLPLLARAANAEYYNWVSRLIILAILLSFCKHVNFVRINHCYVDTFNNIGFICISPWKCNNKTKLTQSCYETSKRAELRNWGGLNHKKPWVASKNLMRLGKISTLCDNPANIDKLHL